MNELCNYMTRHIFHIQRIQKGIGHQISPPNPILASTILKYPINISQDEKPSIISALIARD